MTSSKDLVKTEIPIYEEIYPVFSFLIDPLKRLSIPALFGILGDAAGRDASRRGWGYDELFERNQAWVLVRSKILINRQPVLGEQIILRTWPKLMEGVVAFRDFQILDINRSVIVAGSSAWTLIDLATRKPVRLIGKEYDTGTLATYHAISGKPVKLVWPAELQTVTVLTAKFGQLDMNNHVNNTRYIEWVMNELPIEILLTRQLNAVEVNFLSEVKHLDEVRIVMPSNRPASNIMEGFVVYKEDNRPAFAARFTFVEE